jgi:hypothetical protein
MADESHTNLILVVEIWGKDRVLERSAGGDQVRDGDGKQAGYGGLHEAELATHVLVGVSINVGDSKC